MCPDKFTSSCLLYLVDEYWCSGGTCCLHHQARGVPSARLWHHNPGTHNTNFYCLHILKFQNYCILLIWSVNWVVTVHVQGRLSSAVTVYSTSSLLSVWFVTLHCVTLHRLFVVELFVFSGSVAVAVTVQLFVNDGHLSWCNSNVATGALHTHNVVQGEYRVCPHMDICTVTQSHTVCHVTCNNHWTHSHCN
jgi:hypothetical protein